MSYARLGDEPQTVIVERRFVAAALGGALAGVAASLLRSVGPEWLSGLAGGIAVWVTIGFLLARTSRGLRDAVLVAGFYQATWLLVFYSSQRALIDGTTARIVRDALPWLVFLVPGACLVGLLAYTSLRRGLLGDACLALPLAWSTQEAIRELGRGPGFVAGAVVTVLVGAVPLVLGIRGRRVHPATVVVVLVVGALLIGLTAHAVQHAPITSARPIFLAP
jgi:hypothetical protein